MNADEEDEGKIGIYRGPLHLDSGRTAGERAISRPVSLCKVTDGACPQPETLAYSAGAWHTKTGERDDFG